MRFTARTYTLLARELDQITDRLSILVNWLEAAELPRDLRHTARDLIAALESVDLARMDTTDALADSTDAALAEAGLDDSIARHPAGKHATPDETDDQADDIDPGVREIASLAALAFVADPERTRAALAGIGSTDPREPGDIVAAPTFERTIDELDAIVPPTTPEAPIPTASVDDHGTETTPAHDSTTDAPEAGTDETGRWDETHDAMLDDGDEAGETL